MSKKKTAVKATANNVEVKEVTIDSRPEFNKAADHLLGAIRSHCQNILGFDPTRDELHDMAVKVLEGRK